MGDPKKTKKKYKTPTHPWQRERIEEERVIVKEYGMKNKKEIWKIKSMLAGFKDQVKKLTATPTAQAEIEKNLLMKKLLRIGLLKEGSRIDDVLGLTLKNIMDRRLQTLVFKKGLSRTMNQARQFIVHEHVMIGNKKITSPNYIISVEEEGRIGFSQNSSLSSNEHPERTPVERKEKPKQKKVLRKRETRRGR